MVAKRKTIKPVQGHDTHPLRLFMPSGFVNKEQENSILLLSGFIAAVVLDKAHNLVRKGFPAGFAEMDMNVKGRAADVLHKVGFGGQRGNGCGGAGLAGFIVHRLSFQR